MTAITRSEGDTIKVTNDGAVVTQTTTPVVSHGFNGLWVVPKVAIGEECPLQIEGAFRIPVTVGGAVGDAATPAGTLLKWNAGKTAYGPTGGAFTGKILGRLINDAAAGSTTTPWVKLMNLGD